MLKCHYHFGRVINAVFSLGNINLQQKHDFSEAPAEPAVKLV